MTMERCDLLSDKLPLVVHGRVEWTADESAHLAQCPACAAEWRLVERARGLGEGAAARIDPARLAAGVLAGVAARRRRDRWTRAAWLAGLAAAAAVTLVVWTRGPGGRNAGVVAARDDSGHAIAVEVGFHLPLAELEPLDTEELQTVLDGLDAPMGEVAPGPAPSFGDLDDHQLERVLRSLEG